MNNESLPKNYFKKHPLEEFSAARFADLSIRLVHADDLNANIDQMLLPRIESGRRADISRQKSEIEELDSPEEIVAYMRKAPDLFFYPLLCKKALTMPDDVIPLILKRYTTTFQDHFIEIAVRILGNADRKFTFDLLELYPKIRNPYARSMACLLFGEQRLEESVTLLLSEVERFEKQFPDQSHAQGPLLALWLMFGD